jgi:hypothetical protein
MCAILLWFVGWIVVCAADDICVVENTSKLTLPIGILNLLVCLMLSLSTYMLVKQWRSRYGDNF